MRTFALPNAEQVAAMLRVMKHEGRYCDWKLSLRTAYRANSYQNLGWRSRDDGALLKAAISAMGAEWMSRFSLRGNLPRWGREKGPRGRRYSPEERAQIAAATAERGHHPFTIDPEVWPREVRVAAAWANGHARDNPCGLRGVSGVRGGGSVPDWMVDCPACQCILNLRALTFLAPLRPSKQNRRCSDGGQHDDLGRWKCAKLRAGENAPSADMRRIEDGPVPVPRACAPQRQDVLSLVFRREPVTGRWEIVETAA